MSFSHSNFLYTNSTVQHYRPVISKLQQQRQLELINKQREANFNACVNGVFNEKSRKPILQQQSKSRKHQPKPSQSHRSTWTKLTNDSERRHNANNGNKVNSSNEVNNHAHRTTSTPLTHTTQSLQYDELMQLHNNINTLIQPRITSAGNINNNSTNKPRKKWTRQVSLPLFTDHTSDNEYEDDFVSEQILRPLSTNTSRQATSQYNIQSNNGNHTSDLNQLNNTDETELVEIEVDDSDSEDEFELTMDA